MAVTVITTTTKERKEKERRSNERTVLVAVPRFIAGVGHDEVVVAVVVVVLAAASSTTAAPAVGVVGPVAGLAEGVEVQAVRAVEEVQLVLYAAREGRGVSVVAVERPVVPALDSQPVSQRWLRPGGQNGQHPQRRHDERGAARGVSDVCRRHG